MSSATLISKPLSMANSCLTFPSTHFTPRASNSPSISFPSKPINVLHLSSTSSSSSSLPLWVSMKNKVSSSPVITLVASTSEWALQEEEDEGLLAKLEEEEKEKWWTEDEEEDEFLSGLKEDELEEESGDEEEDEVLSEQDEDETSEESGDEEEDEVLSKLEEDETTEGSGDEEEDEVLAKLEEDEMTESSEDEDEDDEVLAELEEDEDECLGYEHTAGEWRVSKNILFIRNLPYDMDSAEVADLFQQAGTPEVVQISFNRKTKRSRGIGLVVMSTPEELEKAVKMFNGYEINGRLLNVYKASPKGSRPERTPREFEPSFRVYVGNLPLQADEARLEQVFSEHGKVVNVWVAHNLDTERSRGYGFVTMSSQTEMDDAIAALDGQIMEGNEISVNVAE